MLPCAQDAFEKLNLPGESLRGRIRIQYVDHYGEVRYSLSNQYWRYMY